MSTLCRSQRELSNAYLLAKIGFDTTENDPSKVWSINRSEVRADADEGAEADGGREPEHAEAHEREREEAPAARREDDAGAAARDPAVRRLPRERGRGEEPDENAGEGRERRLGHDRPGQLVREAAPTLARRLNYRTI